MIVFGFALGMTDRKHKFLNRKRQTLIVFADGEKFTQQDLVNLFEIDRDLVAWEILLHDGGDFCHRLLVMFAI